MIACTCGQCCLVGLGDAILESMLHRHLLDWPGSNAVACHYQHERTGSMSLLAVASSCMPALRHVVSHLGGTYSVCMIVLHSMCGAKKVLDVTDSVALAAAPLAAAMS